MNSPMPQSLKMESKSSILENPIRRSSHSIFRHPIHDHTHYRKEVNRMNQIHRIEPDEHDDHDEDHDGM